MYVFRIVTALSLFFFSYTHANEICKEFQNSCDYYACMDENYPCEKKNYLNDFGLKYCKKYIQPDFFENRSVEGQVFLKEVAQCLRDQLAIIPPPSSDNLKTCKSYRKKAINTHSPCYVHSGFCELSLDEKKDILKMASSQFWRPSILLEGTQIKITCLTKD